MKQAQKTTVMIIMAICMLVYAASAFGYTDPPVAGDMGYEFYDWANRFCTSGYMYGVGIVGIIVAIYFLIHTNLRAVLFTLAAVFLAIRPQSIITGFGLNF